VGELGGEEESSEYGNVARKGGVATSGQHTVKRRAEWGMERNEISGMQAVGCPMDRHWASA